jgi:hypothetical protein
MKRRLHYSVVISYEVELEFRADMPFLENSDVIILSGYDHDLVFDNADHEYLMGVPHEVYDACVPKLMKAYRRMIESLQWSFPYIYQEIYNVGWRCFWEHYEALGEAGAKTSEPSTWKAATKARIRRKIKKRAEELAGELTPMERALSTEWGTFYLKKRADYRRKFRRTFHRIWNTLDLGDKMKIRRMKEAHR